MIQSVRLQAVCVVFASIVVGFSAIAQQSPPPGTHEVSMRWSEINQILHDIEPHAREYPARFDSAQQRSAMQTELMRLLVFLDAAVKEQPDDSDYWFRDAIANGFGHNMGCRDCGEKAIAAFERVERLQPESADVNWRYGAFLAQTAQHEKSIPYLQKAASLGVVDAHYTAAIVFISLNDLPHAMLELKEYLKAVPKDEQAKKLLADMAHGNLHIQVQDGPPPAIPERDK